MAVTKLALYNDGLNRAGAERLADVTEAVEARYKLDEIWDIGAPEHCFRLAKPSFARKTAKSTTATTTSTHGLEYEHTLPADFLGVVEIYADENMDTRVQRYFIEGNKLYSEFATVWLRYVADYSSDFTNWSTDFAAVVSAWLALQYAYRVVPERAGDLSQKFDEELATSQALTDRDEPGGRPQKSSTTLSLDWLRLYNEALSILKRPRLVSVNDEREDRIALDTAREGFLVNKLLSDYAWQWARTTVKLTYNSALQPVWGYQYGFTKPTDILKFDGIFYDEYLQQPVKHYRDESGVIYTVAPEIYITYIQDTLETQPTSWPSHFWRYAASELAVGAMGHIPDVSQATMNEARAVARMRQDDAENWDFSQAPPTLIKQGSWTRARMFGSSRFRIGDASS